MSVYRVLSASIYRGSGILKLVIEDSDDEDGPDLEVEGQPQKTLRVKSGRIVYDGDGVSNRRIFVVDIPSYPIDELKGQRLRGKSTDGNRKGTETGTQLVNESGRKRGRGAETGTQLVNESRWVPVPPPNDSLN